MTTLDRMEQLVTDLHRPKATIHRPGKMIVPAPDALERWAAEQLQRELAGDFEPVAPRPVMTDPERLSILHRLTWQRRERAIRESGHPLNMPEGTYGGLIAYPPGQTTTTTSIAGTVNLWPNLVFTPIPQNAVLAPQVYRVVVVAKITTSTVPGNITVVPAISSTGTWVTGGQAATGTTLGSSAAIALTASITNAFYYLYGDMTITAPGTSSSVRAMFHFVSTQNTAAGLAGPAAISAAYNLLLGGTTLTVDTQTTAQSFQLGMTHTVTTITHNVEQIHWMDWN